MSSMAVGGWVQSGLLAQLVADNTATKAQLDTLTAQSASGKVSSSYGGLGTAAHVSLNLRPQMSQMTTWQQNISLANTTLDTTQSVLKQLSSIVSTFSSAALGTDMETADGARALATQASQALDQVVTLLNTTSNGDYTFGGADSSTAPVSTTEIATFASSAATEVAGLSSGTAPATAVSDLLSAGTSAAFTYDSSGTYPAGVTTPIATGRSVNTAFVAGVNSCAKQSGTSTTGSYVRDIITALAGLAGLSNTTADQATLQGFGTGISKILQGATSALATEQAGFGEIQTELTTRSTEITDAQTSLTKQVSSVEDVDMTATATALSTVQTQLQASYKLISNITSLSLTTYL